VATDVSKHREILEGVVGWIREADPNAGVVLFGSVMGGQERPDSDLDLLVVQDEFREIRFPDSRVVHEEQGMHLIRGTVEGVRVDLACWSVEALCSEISTSPYLFYPFTLGTILCDPRRLADGCLQPLRQYMQAAPAVVAAWAHQLEELARHKKNAAQPLQFREWGDFAAHLRQTISV
jgi:predicted nucleotidyltransferase